MIKMKWMEEKNNEEGGQKTRDLSIWRRLSRKEKLKENVSVKGKGNENHAIFYQKIFFADNSNPSL